MITRIEYSLFPECPTSPEADREHQHDQVRWAAFAVSVVSPAGHDAVGLEPAGEVGPGTHLHPVSSIGSRWLYQASLHDLAPITGSAAMIDHG